MNLTPSQKGSFLAGVGLWVLIWASVWKADDIAKAIHDIGNMYWTDVPRLHILMGPGGTARARRGERARRPPPTWGGGGCELALPNTIWAEQLRLSENGTNARHNRSFKEAEHPFCGG